MNRDNAHLISSDVLDISSLDKKIDMDDIKIRKLLELIHIKLKILSVNYPNFDNWILGKVFPEISDGERKVLIEWRDNKIAGIAIIKNTIDEKKLCCLRVEPEFQHTGIGILLIKRSMQELETDKPLLSISSNNKHLNEFFKIFNYFGYQLEEKYNGLYIDNVEELAFNGILDSDSDK